MFGIIKFLRTAKKSDEQKVSDFIDDITEGKYASNLIEIKKLQKTLKRRSKEYKALQMIINRLENTPHCVEILFLQAGLNVTT